MDVVLFLVTAVVGGVWSAYFVEYMDNQALKKEQ